MRSTPVVACRAVVMLAVLFLVPALALFWESIPSLADELLVACKEKFGISLIDPATWLQQDSDDAKTELADAPRFAPVPANPLPEPNRGLVQQAGGALAGGNSARAGSGAVRASYEVAVQQPPSAGGGSAEATPPRGEDSFRAVQARLRELGATYYLLESWGDGGRYRFHCRMAIAGNTSYSRQFEALAGDPLAAMLAVLRQVEDWRAGRQP
jgi:hypothetical protein